MRRTDGLAALAAGDPGQAVVSIGVFDGVHLGHRAILAANRARAERLGATPTVVTFRGHPKELLLGRSPLTLTSLEHRLELFAEAGIEHTLVLDFTEHLRSLDAEAFTREVLVDGLGVQAFVLGFDSKFGRDRLGTPAFLRERGFAVEVVDAVRRGGRAVSSTAIREAVTLGDLEGAEAMLGRQFGPVATVDHTDGVRISFASGEIAHLRPSGNAPELRAYTEADTPQRAAQMNRICLELLEGWRTRT